MTIKATSRGRRASYWAWPGPADLYVGLIFGAVWIPVLVFARQSGFVMASATALTICAGVVWQAIRGDWPLRIAWGARTGAAVAGGWLFVATPGYPGRFIAVAIFAALYILCDRAASRRARSDQNIAT